MQGREIEPLRASDLGTGSLFRAGRGEFLVQREADGLNGDIRGVGAFKEGPVQLSRLANDEDGTDL